MNELEAARALLPVWVRVVPWTWGLGLGAAGAALLGLRLSRAGVPDATLPWFERARLTYPARLEPGQVRLVLVVCGLLAVVMHAGAGWVTGAPGFAAAVSLAGLWTWPTLAGLAYERRLRRESWRVLARSLFASTLLRFGVLVVLFAACVPTLDGAAAWALRGAAFVAVLWLGAGGSVLLVRALGLGRPAGERARAAVARASARLGVAVRSVDEVDWAQANAVAFPLSRRVAFTTKAAEVLDDAELEAVAAHELGHVAEPGWQRVGRLAPIAVVALVVLGAGAASSWRTLDLAGVVEVLLFVLALLLVTVVAARRLARHGERHADAHAKDEAGVYARALEKIYAANLVPAVLRAPGAHGHLYDRLVAAGQPPSWPRPSPPGRSFLGPLLAAGALLLAVPTATAAVVDELMDGGPERAALVGLALERSDAAGLLALGDGAVTRGQLDDAGTWYRAAAAQEPRDPEPPLALAMLDAARGRCPEASADFAKGQRLVKTKWQRRSARLEAARLAVERCESPGR